MAKHIVTERPYFKREGVTLFLDAQATAFGAPRVGDTVHVAEAMGPDEEGDVVVYFNGRHFPINTEALAETF